jgi:hypothetical protein
MSGLVSKDTTQEQLARIDMILEELRLHTEDLRELTRQANLRARDVRVAHTAVASASSNLRTSRRARRPNADASRSRRRR